MIDKKLEVHFDAVDLWAKGMLQAGQEPPWVWYELMKLREALEALRTNSMKIPDKYIGPDLTVVD